MNKPYCNQCACCLLLMRIVTSKEGWWGGGGGGVMNPPSCLPPSVPRTVQAPRTQRKPALHKQALSLSLSLSSLNSLRSPQHTCGRKSVTSSDSPRTCTPQWRHTRALARDNGETRSGSGFFLASTPHHKLVSCRVLESFEDVAVLER